VTEDEYASAQVNDSVGLDRKLLPRLPRLLHPPPGPFVASIHGLHVRKDAREMNLEIRGEGSESSIIVTPVRRLVHRGHDLDILLRHEPTQYPHNRER
jgi:hypothetical protein